MDATSSQTARRIFPGGAGRPCALAIPIAGLIGGRISGPRRCSPSRADRRPDLTGAGLGAAQWFAAKGAFGDGPAAWIATSAVAYGAGLLVAAAAVGYSTDIGSLVAMGAISGLVPRRGTRTCPGAAGPQRLALAWASRCRFCSRWDGRSSTLIGVDVDNQFTVFGASGAIVFMLLSGLLLGAVLRRPRLGPREANSAAGRRAKPREHPDRGRDRVDRDADRIQRLVRAARRPVRLSRHPAPADR